MRDIPEGEEPSARPEPASRDTATSLTTGALARRLGVSPTTLRSWDRRYGIGPAVRADGRHRRWTPPDIAVLETMCRLTSAGVPPAEAARAAKRSASPEPAGSVVAPGSAEPGDIPVLPGSAQPADGPDLSRSPEPVPRSRAAGTLPLGDVRQECRGLARAAVRLDAPAVQEQLAAAVETHGLAVAWQEVMVPTLHAVGRKWASSGDRYVEVEHLLSWHMSTALRRCTHPPARHAETPGPGPVVLACVPGEQHTLALEALNAGLTELRLPTRMFGAAVPAEALIGAVERLGPAAVVLWAQVRSTASLPLARHLAGTGWGVKGARRRPVVVLGGPGWVGRSGQGMLRPTSFQDALDTIAGLYGAGSPRPAGSLRRERGLSRGPGPA